LPRTVAQSYFALTAAIVLVTVAVVLASGGSALQALVWAAALAFGARVVPVLLSFALAYWPRGGTGPPPLAAPAAARMVLREAWAATRLFFFYHPWQKWLAPLGPGSVAAGQTPILLVHGFYANAGFWQRTRQVLAGDGWHNLFALNLEPPFAGIDDYAQQLRARIEEVCERCQCDSLIIVAHSMGGLVARSCTAGSGARIRHIICLGTPHRGTLLARLLPVRTTRQMRPGSAWLRELEARESAAVPVTNIYSEHDNIIVPQASARWGENNRALCGIAHMDMAFSAALQQALRRTLAALRDEHEH